MLCYILGPVKRVYTPDRHARQPDRSRRLRRRRARAGRRRPGDLSRDCRLGRSDHAAPLLLQRPHSREQHTALSQCHDPWTFTGDTPELAERIEAALARFVGQPEGFAGQFYRFADALRREAEPPVTLADARAALELITAMYTAARTGQAVDLPIGKDHPGYAGWLPESAAGD